MKLCEVNKNELSPMMQQYASIKSRYEDKLLFFRLGDFYELFFEDALIASRELELTLTGKVAGLKERVPMCGVPHHSVKSYLEKLVNKGYKVALAEQLEDAKNVKGMVKRDVVSVVSKATIADFELLDQHSESFIGSLITFKDIYILTYLDISTGKLNSVSVKLEDEAIINEILSLSIKELIMINNENITLIDKLKNSYFIDITYSDKLEEEAREFATKYDSRVIMGIKHLFYYLENNLLKDLNHINEINIVNKLDYMQLDIYSVKNLELVETIRYKERTFSLLWLLDKTKTAIGSRLLKQYLLNPLKDISKINDRYDKIEKLNNEFILKEELRNNLYEIYDIERLIGKVVNGSINARDLLQIKNSLEVLPEIKNIIKKLNFEYDINTHTSLFELLNSAISLDAPITLKEGGLIKDGYNKELDELKEIRSGGKNFVANFEKQIKEETGIKNLKVGFNKVFGYYIEVSKGSVKDIKPEFGFERRQTLAGAERYISPLLKEKEALILGAEEKINDIEYNLFLELKESVKKEILTLKQTANIISEIDVIAALAQCADDYNLVRPTINNDKRLNIIAGKHPVVEHAQGKEFVPNDCFFDTNNTTILLTGPNMSGKSTYMRQIAITIIMAQMGSFVPAKSADIPIIDKIFTRIGASDDLVAGESTFMVEMKEARNAIVNATENSLILFDELGRGTATYDGMAIAKAILEYVSTKIKCFTLFSTHYHELTSIDKKIPNIKNMHVSAVEENNAITFLHKVKSGPVDRSYGVHVASLAKLPNDLLARASEILNEYENNSKSNSKINDVYQLSLGFENEKKDDTLEKELKELDILNITPLEAMNKLFELKKIVNEKES